MISEINNKKYDYEFKKNIVLRIEKIKNKKNYIKLYDIIKKNDVEFTKNNNGVFFNVNKLSDNLLVKIDNFLDEINIKRSDSNNISFNSELIDSSFIDDTDESSVKFEKNESTLKKKNYINTDDKY